MKIILSGQVRGGKNNVGITKGGKRYPNQIFAAWRDYAVLEAKRQWRNNPAIEKPCNITIHYHPSDKRRRDVPAILDGLFHVLERAGLVKDDCLLGGIGKCVMFYNMGVSDDPKIEVEFGD